MVCRFRYRFTDITDWFTDFDKFQSLPADRFTDFGTGLPILNFLNAKFKFEVIFDQFYRFSW
jgi:hypothetical protein